MRLAIMILATLALSAVGFGATLKVPADYPTIQDAIDVAVGGDTVLVAPGTYSENINFKGKAILVTSSNGPEATVIDGQYSGSAVRFMMGEGQDSILEGFSITNGTGTWDDLSKYFIGGGIYCYKSSPTIRGNIISANKADHGGGIGCAWGGAPVILGNTIFENTAEGKSNSAGGAILCSQSVDALIADNLMISNTVTGTGASNIPATGGAVQISYGSNCTVTNNVIMKNRAEAGGGIACGGSSTTKAFIANNVVAMNTAEGGNISEGSRGGGISIGTSGKGTVCGNLIYDNKAEVGGGFTCAMYGDAIFTNNTVHGNEATSMGGGISCSFNSTLETMNNIVWDNSSPASSGPEIRIGPNSNLIIDYSNVKGGQADVLVDPLGTLNWGANNMDADPLFAATSEADFHIKYTSPCREAGDDASVPAGLLEDFEGDARCCGTVDMGCDEFFTHFYYTGDATPGGTVYLKFIDVPGTTPVQLWLGSGVMDPPLPTKWGDWHLEFPLLFQVVLGSIPSPDGLLALPVTFPGDTPTPLDLAMQAGIGKTLTNLCLMTVE